MCNEYAECNELEERARLLFEVGVFFVWVALSGLANVDYLKMKLKLKLNLKIKMKMMLNLKLALTARTLLQ